MSAAPLHMAYLAHPLGAATEAGVRANHERAKRWYRWATRTYFERGIGFQASWILWIEACGPGADVEGTDPTWRENGLAFDDAEIQRCDLFVMVGGRVSAGMQRGMDLAVRTGKLIWNLSYLGDEPPPIGKGPPLEWKATP